MKKILLYTDCFYFGGCENVLPVLLKDKKLNSKFKLSFSYRYSLEYEIGLRQRLEVNQYHINKIKLPGYKESKSIISKINNRLISVLELLVVLYDIKVLFSHFKKINPDIVFINNGGYPGARSCRSAVIAAKLSGIKKIYLNINNIAEPYDTFKRLMQFPLDMYVKFCVTNYITASKFAKKKLIDVLNLKNHDVIWLVNSFQPNTNISFKRKKDDIRPDKKTILIGCVGELSQNKGHFYLLEAVKILKESFKKNIFKVILIGDGPEKENLIKKVINYQIQDYISIIPYQKKIFDFYLSMDMYVHPSIAFDDLPFAIREAMSASLPIIATNFAGIPEIVNDGKNGILVTPRDKNALANAISYLIINKKIRKNMGIESKNIFQKKLSTEVSLKGYWKLFNLSS